MRRSQAQLKDSRLEAEKRRTYKGSARISLDVLYFQWDEHRDLDPKHVEYLKGCFKRDRCRRLEVRNHIDAVVDQPSLDVALRKSGVSARELLTNQPNGCPWLEFPKDFQLHCVHGQHRIQAAREFLLPTDKWWTVDLYTSDLNKSLKQCLNEQHSNEDRPSDGEAYYKIRRYHFQGDTESEMRWKACLRGSRLKNLKELIADEDLTAGFDALLAIPGLWEDMRLTTLQKMMAMGSKYEILNYIGHIKQFFSDLVGGDKHAMMKIGRAEVKTLEMRAPGVSTADAQFLRTQLRGGAIFSSFTDQEREQIWDRLQTFDGLIPSLFTLFRDINYLQLLVDCLKRLVSVPKRQSVGEIIQGTYTGVNQEEGQVKIQVAEDTFIQKPGNDAARIDLGYRQLIALAMRDYPDMPRDPVKEDAVKKSTTSADQAVLRELADLAYQLGFDSPQIKTLKQYPNKRSARGNHPSLPPLHVTSGSGIKLAQRSGIPRTREYKEDRQSLFINHLHEKQTYQGEGITSFFVRKSIYLAFFGRPDEAITDTNTENESPPNSPFSGGSQRGPIRGDSNRPQLHSTSRSQGTPGYIDEDIDEIVSSYRRREDTTQSRGRQRQEQERWVQEALEQEILEQERLEQERLEQEGLEQERLEEENREQARLEEERRERERLEQEGLEQERLELRRIEERLEQEELQERLGQALEAQENLEQEKQNQQTREKQDQERQEEETRRQQTREQARRDQEKSLYDSERIRKRHTQIDMGSIVPGATGNQGREQVVHSDLNAARNPQTPVNDQTTGRQKRLEQETSQEGFAQELREQEELEQEKQAELKRKQDRLAQGKQRRERREQMRQEERTMELEENIELPQKRSTTTLAGRQPEAAEITRSKRKQDPTPLSQTSDSVWITFKVRERGVWRTAQSLHVYSSEPSEVERIAVKYIRKREQMRLYDTDLNILTPQMCFQAAIANGSNMLLLIPEREIDINDELEASVSRLLSEIDHRQDDGIE